MNATMHRGYVTDLTSAEFQDRLETTSQIVQKVVDAVKSSIVDDNVQSWDYPQIESAIGLFAAAIYGVPTGQTFTLERLLGQSSLFGKSNS